MPRDYLEESSGYSEEQHECGYWLYTKNANGKVVAGWFSGERLFDEEIRLNLKETPLHPKNPNMPEKYSKLEEIPAGTDPTYAQLEEITVFLEEELELVEKLNEDLRKTIAMLKDEVKNANNGVVELKEWAEEQVEVAIRVADAGGLDGVAAVGKTEILLQIIEHCVAVIEKE